MLAKKTKLRKFFFMLTSTLLAELEASQPSMARERAEDESTVSSSMESNGHSIRTTKKVDSIEKWCLAALRALGKSEIDLLVLVKSTTVTLCDVQLVPNDQLASDVLAKLGEWFESKVKGEDVGVDVGNGSVTVPSTCQKVGKQWLRRCR